MAVELPSQIGFIIPHSPNWTGTSLQLKLMQGNIIKERLMSFALTKYYWIGLSSKLV